MQVKSDIGAGGVKVTVTKKNRKMAFLQTAEFRVPLTPHNYT